MLGVLGVLRTFGMLGELGEFGVLSVLGEVRLLDLDLDLAAGGRRLVA